MRQNHFKIILLHLAMSSHILAGIAQLPSKRTDTTGRNPELFTAGLFDVMNNGQMNVAARFVKLNIGEPGKFEVPLSIFSGVTSNNLKDPGLGRKSNDHLYNNFINPTTGLVNICVENVLFFDTTSRTQTKFGLQYQLGERILSGHKVGLQSDPGTGKPVNFVNTYGVFGLVFKTGAWERSNSRNMGICWVSLRYIGCYSNEKQLQQLISDIETNGFYHGYSIGWGVEITNLLNIKVIYYKYTKAPEIQYGKQVYQFSFNYSLK